MFRIDKHLVNLSDSMPLWPASGSQASSAAGVGESPERGAELIAQALEEADRIREQADEDARQILEDAQEQAEAHQQMVFDKGYANGMAAGAAEAKEALIEQQRLDSQSVHRLLSEIESERERIINGLEAEIIDLTMSTVKKIINFCGETDDKIFESMIVKALKQVKPEGRITIRVSSAEYEKYFSSGSAAFDLGGETLDASVLPDATLGFFDVIIDSDSGTINAGLDSQLKQVGQAFDEAAEYEDD